MQQPNNPLDFVFLPPRATVVTVEEVERRTHNPYQFTWGIPEIDKRMIPPVAGDMISILARQGMGKTTTMISLARRWAEQCRKMNPTKPPLIAFCTWETTVEEFVSVATAHDSGQTLEMIGRGQADLGRIKGALVKMLGNNLVIIGRSASQRRIKGTASELDRALMPTLPDVNQAFAMLLDQGFEIAAAFFDYLQAIPDKKRNFDRDRTPLITENTFMVKEMAVAQGFVATVGVQSDRRVDKYEGLRLPQPSDSQWASAIEQTTDKLFSQTIPAKYTPVGDEIHLNGWRYPCAEKSLAVQMVKQRFGPYAQEDIWMVEADFATATYKPHPVLGEVQDKEDF